MPSNGTYTAVVDRFEEDLAVLLLEEDGETVGEISSSTRKRCQPTAATSTRCWRSNSKTTKWST